MLLSCFRSARAAESRQRTRGLTSHWGPVGPAIGLAPDPATTPEPIVAVYGARCSGWRGYFGIHTWIAVKPAHARTYTVYEVVPRNLRGRPSAMVVRRGPPDARWYGRIPALLAQRRGEGVTALIERIEGSVRGYPYRHRYLVWPGPNSNTFTAHIARALPELALDLPPTAIGKDYLVGRLIARAPSGHGWQVSLLGLLSVLVSRVEGFEINVLGLAFGIDPFACALKLPLLGRIGAARTQSASSEAGSPSLTRHIPMASPRS